MTTPDTPDLADHRPDVYRDNNRWVFRASSFGGCDQALVKAAVGIAGSAKPEFLSTAMATSAAYEAPVIAALSTYGWSPLSGLVLEQYGDIDTTGQLALELNVPGRETGGLVRCHPDGIVQCFKAKVDGSQGYVVKDRAVLEVKVMSGARRDVLAEKLYYQWQTSVEMAATGLPLLWVLGWKDDDKELVRRSDGLLDLTVAYLPAPTFTRVDISARVRALVQAITVFDDGAGFPVCNTRQFPCPYFADHDTTKGVWMDDKVKVGGATRVKLKRLAEGLDAIQIRIKQDQEKADEMKATMLELCRTEDLIGKLDVGGGVTVNHVVKAGARRFDKFKAVEKWGLKAIDECYTVGKPSDYIAVDVS